jgi:hypothetical protein
MIAEYIEHALQFERWANDAKDAKLKEQFLKQAIPPSWPLTVRWR